MIRYTLQCDRDHSFESWFQSAATVEKLLAAGMVACAVCGSTTLRKALMAPAVRPTDKAAVPTAAASGGAPAAGGAPDSSPERPLGSPRSEIEAALAAMRRHVAEHSEYVGLNFAAEARAIHDGAAPERSIHGEARPDEARALIEDGIPVAPLPFLPPRKVN